MRRFFSLSIVLFVLVSFSVFAQVQLAPPQVAKINPSSVTSDPNSDVQVQMTVSGKGLLGHTEVKLGAFQVAILENNNPNLLKIAVVVPKDSSGDYPLTVGPVATGLNFSVKNQQQVQEEKEEAAKEAIRSGAASGSLANGRVIGVIKAIFAQAYGDQADSFWRSYLTANRDGADALVTQALNKIAGDISRDAPDTVAQLTPDDIATIIGETLGSKFQEAEGRMVQYTDQVALGLKGEIEALRAEVELNREAAKLALEGVVELDAKTKKVSEKDQRKPDKRPLDPATKDSLRQMLGKLAQQQSQ